MDLVTYIILIWSPSEEEDDPQQRGGGGLRPRLEEVQAGQLQRLHVEVGISPLLHLQQVHVNQVSSLW